MNEFSLHNFNKSSCIEVQSCTSFLDFVYAFLEFAFLFSSYQIMFKRFSMFTAVYFTFTMSNHPVLLLSVVISHLNIHGYQCNFKFMYSSSLDFFCCALHLLWMKIHYNYVTSLPLQVLRTKHINLWIKVKYGQTLGAELSHVCMGSL